MPDLPDPYRRESVRLYLDLPVQTIGGGFVKALLGLGDRFSVTCSMLLTDEQLKDPQKVQRICAALEFAFKRPAQRDCDLDAFPVFSIFFTARIHELATDPVSQELTAKCLEGLRSFRID